MTLEEALAGKEIPKDISDTLTLIAVPFLSFDGEVCEGELVVHADLAEETKKIFNTLFEKRFLIERMVPVVMYGWDDDASMAANNSSAFNYRFIAGTDRLSNHSFGRAIDINPFQNPYTQRDGKVVPEGAQYDPSQPGTVTEDIAAVFKSHGWQWGGDWQDRKDWQHFEKPN
ncbi:MAG: M15 family metallopeptidase [Candidatus Paceibacterota bacterium]|jgi:hypothetical protein